MALVAALLGGVFVAYLRPEITKATRDVDRTNIVQVAESQDAGEPEGFSLSGSHLSIELISAPQTHYLGHIEEDAGDAEFRVRIAEIADGVASHDPWLSRAAREIAFQGALLSESPPEPALGFILRSAGAPELSVAQLLVQAKGDDSIIIDDAIASALRNAPTGPGELLLGIGEAAMENDEYDRRVVVIAARRNFDLEPTPRSLGLGEVWEIRGRAPKGFGDARASVLYPDDRIVELPVTIIGQRFEVEVPAGNDPGALRVSIDGMGDFGPGKLLQLEAEVGAKVPTQFDVLVPGEEEFEKVADAERFAFVLLNEDRRRMDLPDLVLDEELSAIARLHSEEMRDESFFAHLSPATGLAVDRLNRAGYRASGHGENLAFNDTVAEAQASLMESVGHRRNIVAESMSEVGIGLARSEAEDGRIGWHLTQLFARKVVPIDASAAARDFLERINEARRAAGNSPLHLDVALQDLAALGCEQGLTEIDGLPSELAPRASALALARVAVSVHVFYELSKLEPDETSLHPDFDRIGLAFAQDEDDMEGRTLLVLIAAE